MWTSRQQPNVALSSAEAEWYSASLAVKEIVFVVQILLSMGIPVELPIVVNVDNMGALFMSRNSTSSIRTRHVDCRRWYTQSFVDDKIVTMEFVCSEGNYSDSFTKNVKPEVYEAHTHKFVVSRAEVEEKE